MILSAETIERMLNAWLNESIYQTCEQVEVVSWSQLRNRRMKIVFRPRPPPPKKVLVAPGVEHRQGASCYVLPPKSSHSVGEKRGS
jgi:hypothetical protein